MKIVKGLSLAFALLLVIFLCYSMSIAPFSVTHGYYVGAAKLMAQGLVPWQDFNIMDLPLGIFLLSLPYRICGITFSGNLAVGLVTGFHIMNVLGIYVLLRKCGVKDLFRWIAVSFYLIILYSTDALMVGLEPFALFFLLLSLLSGREKRWLARVLSALFFLFAVACKAQVIGLLPAVLLYLASPFKEKHWHSRRGVFFGILFVTFSVLSIVALSVCTGTPVLERLPWSLHLSSGEDIKELFINTVIFTVHGSLYFLIPGLLGMGTRHRRTVRFSLLALVAFMGVWVCYIFTDEASVWSLAYPFVVLAFAWGIQDLTSRHRSMWVFYISSFLLPAYLMVREFQKLEMGELKEEQLAYFDVLNGMFDKPTAVALFTYHSFEYDLSSQVYSEVPAIRPFDLKRTWWGLNPWDYESQSFFVQHALSEADYVITNEDFRDECDEICAYTYQNWFEDFDVYLNLNQENTIGLGALQLICNTKK